jgi:type I restriction enzyme S subunit
MLSGKMYRFRARPDLMDPTLLVSYLRSPVAQRAIDRMKTGISDSGLNLTHGRFGRLAIPVPPRSEQRRIVDKIDELLSNLDGGVAALERAKANLARYRAAVLKAAVEGRLTEEWRTRRGRIAVPRGAYELPDGWRMATIGEIADEVRYGTSAKTSKSSQGVPVLRMGNIRDGRLSLDELKYLPDAHDEFPALFLKPGDLLFNRTNSAELVGKSAVYHGTPAPCSFASYLIRVRLRKGIQPEYVNCVINSVYGRRWIRSVVSQQVGQANVNGTKLRALSIPLPPADEQTEIVRLVGEAFDAAERAVSDLTANGERAQTLRQAILALAFSGALWVNR